MRQGEESKIGKASGKQLHGTTSTSFDCYGSHSPERTKATTIMQAKGHMVSECVWLCFFHLRAIGSGQYMLVCIRTEAARVSIHNLT
jgi:hypothetical protein